MNLNNYIKTILSGVKAWAQASFAKKSDVYSKNEVYSKDEVYSKNEIASRDSNLANAMYTAIDSVYGYIDDNKFEVNGAASSIIDTNLTKNLVLVSDSSGKVAVAHGISTNELYYLDGVTSKIQDQLDNKSDADHVHENYASVDHTHLQADWDEQDESSEAYIKNRICYTDRTSRVIVKTGYKYENGSPQHTGFSNTAGCVAPYYVQIGSSSAVEIIPSEIQEGVLCSCTIVGYNNESSYSVVGKLSEKYEGTTPTIWYHVFGNRYLLNGITNPAFYVSDVSVFGSDVDTGEDIAVILHCASDIVLGYVFTRNTESKYYHGIVVGKVFETVHKLDEKYLPESVKVQADWSQNDETASDYVKNRFGGYVTESYTEVVPEMSCDVSTDGGLGDMGSSFLPVSGMKYKVTFDGDDYICVSTAQGTNSIALGTSDFTTTPFVIFYAATDGMTTIRCATAGTHTVAVYDVVEAPVTIDEKFLPDIVATKEYVDAAIGAAIGGSY